MPLWTFSFCIFRHSVPSHCHGDSVPSQSRPEESIRNGEKGFSLVPSGQFQPPVTTRLEGTGLVPIQW